MKADKVYQEALRDFENAIAQLTQTEKNAAKVGGGIRSARFACRYVLPEENQTLYTRIYNIMYDYLYT